ncbi:hypothetical protein BJ138DRAFT_1144596 [Hygrophoropsis aurantiaca]|uniref:Uncharacterized protein n=1 Tax=Hygrophoropsis aurantiaca TaxID=72124 RepID=A0ACB8AMX0_9AGAM|nr:hypothetical protein BJ138DRAFT_1144596 [Hygrophoropsis aurantiaca]
MQETSLTGQCAVCSASSARRCSKCRKVSYCSEEHQNIDWKSHKNHCHPPSGTIVNVSAILFPANETQPRLVSVKCTVEREIDDDDDTVIYHADFEPFLGKTSIGRQLITNIGYDGVELEHPISCYIRDNFLNDGSPLNQSIVKLMNGRAPHKWSGNVLAMKQVDLYSGKLLKASMSDLPTIAEYFKWYPKEISPEDMNEEITRLFGKNAKGVKVVTL